jgi:hypothetical protein
MSEQIIPFEIWREILYTFLPLTRGTLASAMALCRTSRKIYSYRAALLHRSCLYICNGQSVFQSQCRLLRIHGLVTVARKCEHRLYDVGRLAEVITIVDGVIEVTQYYYAHAESVTIRLNTTGAIDRITVEYYSQLDHDYSAESFYERTFAYRDGKVYCPHRINKLDEELFARAEFAAANPPKLLRMHLAKPFWPTQ